MKLFLNTVRLVVNLCLDYIEEWMRQISSYMVRMKESIGMHLAFNQVT